MVWVLVNSFLLKYFTKCAYTLRICSEKVILFLDALDAKGLMV